MTPWTVAIQASLFMEFSRQEFWSRLQFSPPGAIDKMPQYIGEISHVILHDVTQYISGETKIITDIFKERRENIVGS